MITPRKLDFVIPVFSCDLLCEFLERAGHNIANQPNGPDKWFWWCDALGEEQENASDVNHQMVLYYRSREECLHTLLLYPGSSVIMATDDEEFPVELEPFRNSIIHIVDSDPKMLSALQSDLQSFVLKMLRWENRLNFIASNRGSLDDLLNACAQESHSFIYAVGIDFRVKAYSTNVAFPHPSYQEACSNAKAFPADAFDENNPSSSCDCENYGACRSGAFLDRYGNHCYAVPILHKETCFGSLVMVRESKHTIEPGDEQQFEHFSQFAIEMFVSMIEKNAEKNSPHYFFLTSLLDGETLPDNRIDEEREKLGIHPNMTCRVLSLNLQGLSISVDTIMKVLSSLNSRQSVPVIYKGSAVALLYGDANFEAKTHARLLDDLNRHVFLPYGAVCGLSMTFSDIRDLHLGYRQSQLALDCRQYAIREALTMKEPKPISVLEFQDVWAYQFLIGRDMDNDMARFCCENSFLHQLLNSDNAEDRKSFLLLWYYLASGCNGSQVARRLYMHRNTVIYHLKRLESIYDFSLANRQCREMLMFQYRYLLCNMSEREFASLLE